ncbi:MAG: cation:proton antiporter [Candidatus Latescibacteria bacterium 4484_7]|nr:MAG: cation:proton antiporter [Candidatus Latescibacteria bacterium 4484_7]
MRKFLAIVLLLILAVGIAQSIGKIPFGTSKTKVGRYYIDNGVEETGATNIVTSVVVNYRGFDTLGEVTVLFVAALGLGAVLALKKKKQENDELERASLVLTSGCKFLFPFILLFGSYIFIHGHLTPGGGFQGGAVIASAFLLIYLGCRERKINENGAKAIESLSGLLFVVIGLIGLAVGGYFLLNYLPKGIPNTLFSAGIIPIIYIAIGFKVGAELTGIIDNLMEAED